MTRDQSAMDTAESHEDPVVDNGAMWRLVGDKLSAKYRMDQKAQESAMMQLAHIPEPMTKISAFRLMLMLCDPLQFRVNLPLDFFDFFKFFFKKSFNFSEKKILIFQKKKFSIKKISNFFFWFWKKMKNFFMKFFSSICFHCTDVPKERPSTLG